MMYGLMIAVGVIGIVTACVGLVGAGIAGLDCLGNMREAAGWVPLSFVAALVVGGVVGGWGISETASIEREQCEQAGFEWITGECYGSNVNVNGD